jgi:hypothetical protein
LLGYLVCLSAPASQPGWFLGSSSGSERPAELNVFDPSMSLYLPIKLREFSHISFPVRIASTVV